MREFDALQGYPAPLEPRLVGNRSIASRIAASYRDREFYDGARENGYGGLVDDGRWKAVAERMSAEYKLASASSVHGLLESASVLQIGCDKGFLLGEFAKMGISVLGTETSRYAIEHAVVHVEEVPFAEVLPLPDRRYRGFDLVLAIGPVYTLSLADAIRCLREIENLKKKPGGSSFVTLAAWDTEEDLRLLRAWSLLGTTLLRKDEWLEVLNHVGYTGDYKFVTAESLGLRWS